MRLMVPMVALFVLSTALAGCLGGDDGGQPLRGPAACEGLSGTWNETQQTCVDLVPLPEPDVVSEPEAYQPPHYPNDGASERTEITVTSFDGHLVPAAVYKPAIAGPDTQFPVLLHSHGFTGSKMGGPDTAKAYIEAGFGVVSFDQRGHGAATDTSEVNFMQPDIEVLDAMAVIDEIATWDWVLMEPDVNGNPTDDPVLGGIGYSYAGAFQLMTSIFDDRIDAIVPEMSWHNITTALAPNGAIKTGWVGLFYLAGNTISPITFSDDFHQGWAWAMSTNELPAGQFGVVPDIVRELNEASPEYYPGQLDVPTLLLQGMPDTLFPLNQAVWNYEELARNNASVQLATYNGGHVLHTDNYAAASPIGAGLQGGVGGWPCGGREELGILWHQKHLLQLDVDTGPKVCLALEDETVVTGDEWPLPDTDFQTIDVGGPWPIAQAVGGSIVPLHVVEPAAETVVAGIPRLKGSVTSPGADAIVFFSFQKLGTDGLLEHIVHDQVRPLRIQGPNTGPIEFDIELGGIGTRLAPGEQMVLVASSIEPMFIGNSERLPAGLVLDDLVLELPVVGPSAPNA